jgi:hypothetical protein
VRAPITCRGIADPAEAVRTDAGLRAAIESGGGAK